MNISDKWIKKALQHQGIKGEHAYLQAIKDVIEELNKEIEQYRKLGKKFNGTAHERIAITLTDFKLKLFNTNKKKK